VLIVVSVYFVIDSVRKLLDTPCYINLVHKSSPRSGCWTPASCAGCQGYSQCGFCGIYGERSATAPDLSASTSEFLCQLVFQQ